MANETFTVNETITLKPGADADGDGLIDPGEVVRTTVTITNNSTTPTPVDATGVQFQQILAGMTIFNQTGDDVNVSPIAYDDAYNVIGNTTFTVSAADGIFGGPTAMHGTASADMEFFSATIGANPATQTHLVTTGTIDTVGGTVFLNADGSFTYNPDAGFTGTDSFNYQLIDLGLDGVVGGGDDLTGTGTVTFTVEGTVWFIDNSAGVNGDGTQDSPFNSILNFNAVNDGIGVTHPAAGDNIYLREGTGTYSTADGITLLNNQILTGQGQNLVINHSLQGNMTIETGSSGDTPVILVTGAGNQGIQLAQNNTIAGLDIGMSNATSVAIKDNGGTVGTLTISNLGIGVGGNSTGQAIEIDNGGTINILLESVTSNGGANGIDIASVAGTGNHFTVSGATSIGDVQALGGGIVIVSSTANATFTGLVTILNDAVGADGSGININTSGSGTFAFNGGVNIEVNGIGVTALDLQTAGTVNIVDVGTTQVISNAGTAIFVNPTTLNASLDTVTSGGGGTGMRLESMSGSLTIGTVSINGQSNTGIILVNSAGSLTINGGSIGDTNDPAGIAVDINGGAGNVIIGATINDATDAGDVIEITGRTGGTIDFNGAITSTGGGIDINTNTGGTVRFDGGMNINTGTIAAFNASGNTGMTLVVTDTVSTSNVLATTTGTALNVANTTIGSEDLTFLSISANGAVNGIVLNTTGSSGGLTVTGDGGGVNNGSGGTIQNTTGDAISLTSTMDVTLGRMNLTNNDGMGIIGNTVNGLVLTRLNITGNGDSAAADEGGIRLIELIGDATHLTQFNNIVVTNSFEHNVFIRNTTGTLTNLVVTGSTFSNNGASTQAGMHFIFEGGSGGLAGTPTMTAHFTNNTFTGSTTVGQLTSHALQAAANEGTVNVHIGDGTVGGRNIFTTNAVGIDLDTAGTGNLNFDVNNNVLTDTTSNAINIFRGASSTGTVHGFVRNNVIGTQGVATSGSEQGAGVRVGSEGGGVTRILIEDNIIQSIGVNGVSGGPNIDLTQGIAGPPGGYVEGTLHATVIDNTLRDNADDRAMNVTARNGTINVDFHGNTLSGITGTSGTFLRLSAASLVPADDGVINVPQASLAAIAAANTGLTAAQISSNGTINFNQAAPLLPNATPLMAGGPPPAEATVADGEGKGDGTGGGFVTPTPDPAADATPAPAPEPEPELEAHEVIVDDGVLSQAELDWFVGAALERWAATGLDAEQIAALEALSFGVADMSGLYLGSYQPGQVTLDDDGAGSGWYLDATPLDDAEYANGAGTRLTAAPGSAPTGLYDLLTTIMHEMGHALGLGDMHASEYRDDLMYSLLFSGERRLPGADQALDAVTGSITEEEFAGSPINVGPFLLPAGDSVTIQWDATVDSQTNQLIVNPQNTGTASATNGAGFPDQNSNTVTTTLDTLVLGGTVWFDNGTGVGGVATDGIKNGTEPGVDGVILTLFADTGSVVGAWDATDTQIGSPVTSAGGGNYSFTGLAPGEYIVRVDLDNFTAGGSSTALVGRITTIGSADPDDNIDNDDNGAESGGEVFSQAITLAYNTEPDGSPGGPGDDDGDADDDTNFTLDFGFLTPDQQPTLTATAVNPTYSEDGAAVDMYSTVDASTVESLQTITSMTLTVTNVSDGAAEILTFDGSDLALTNGNFVFGTTTNNLDVFVTVSSGTATVSFSGASLTEAELETLVDSLAYRNTSQLPTDANRVVTITELVDSGSPTSPNDNTASLSVGSTVNVDPINDTPVVTVASPLEVVEQVAEAIAPAGTLSDADLDLKNSGNGNYDDAVLTVARNGGSTAQDLLTIVGGAGFVVNGANLETSPGGLVFATFSGGNGSSLVITFTSSGAPATSALVDAVLQAVQYTYTGDIPPATIQLDVTLNDGAPANGQGSVAGNPAAHTASITVNIDDTDENAQPVVDLDSLDGASNDDTNFYPENFPPSAVGTSVTVTDAEGDAITGATITITDPEAGDLLSASGALPGGITVHGSSTATTLVLTGTTTAANYAAALGQLGYSNTGNDPTDGDTNNDRLITVTVTDAFGTSVPRTMTMGVGAINDPPTLTATGDNPTYAEDAPAVDLFDPIAASTVEGGQTFATMRITVTNVTDGASEILAVDGDDVTLTDTTSVGPTSNGVTAVVSVTGTTATVDLTFTATNAALLQTVIDGLTYRNTSQNPTDANRVVTITQLIDSGPDIGDSENTTTLSIVSTVNVNPVNDPAGITGDAAGVVMEAGGLNNGTPGTPSDSGNLDSTDVDNPNDSWNLVLPGAATIGGFGTFGLTAAGVWTYTLNDNHPSVQALNGASTIQDTFNAVTVDGTAQLVTVTINAQNDAATANDDAFATDEATPITTHNVFNNNGSGVDGDPDDPGFAVTAVNGSGVAVGNMITLASGAQLTLNANGTFTYNPNGAFNATPTPGSGASNQPRIDSFTYTVTGGDTATATIAVNGLDTNDLLLGTAGADTLFAGAGNDTLIGGAGVDHLFGNAGDDIFIVGDTMEVVKELTGEGHDVVYTTVNYSLAVGLHVEVLRANDPASAVGLTLIGNALAQSIGGTAGADTLIGGGGADVLGGRGGNDTYIVSDANALVYELSGEGHDVVYTSVSYALSAGYHVEVLTANDPASTVGLTLIGNEFAQNIGGTAGADTLIGGGAADTMAGRGGDDTYLVTDAADFVYELAGEGNDVVYTSVNYTLAAAQHVEFLLASDPASSVGRTLTGNELAQNIGGTAGADTLNGRGGADILAGLGGADNYVFNTALVGGNIDTIIGYHGAGTDGEDLILLDDAIFTGLALGALDPNAFNYGSAALDADDRILYDGLTGALYFDADGVGGVAAVQFATLQDSPSLTAGDFTVI